MNYYLNAIYIAGQYAFVGDSMGDPFLSDISDPESPGDAVKLEITGTVNATAYGNSNRPAED